MFVGKINGDGRDVLKHQILLQRNPTIHKSLNKLPPTNVKITRNTLAGLKINIVDGHKFSSKNQLKNLQVIYRKLPRNDKKKNRQKYHKT